MMQELFFRVNAVGKSEHSDRQQPAVCNKDLRAASLQETAHLVAAYMDNTEMGSRQSGINNQICTRAECSTLLTLAFSIQISKHICHLVYLHQLFEILYVLLPNSVGVLKLVHKNLAAARLQC